MPVTVVFLSAHLPAPNAPQAGQAVAFRHLELISEFYPVHLISFANRSEQDWPAVPTGLCRSVSVIPVSWRSRLWGALQRPDLPLYVASRHSRVVERGLSHVVQKERQVVVWAEYTQMAQYVGIGGVPRRSWVVVCQDVLSQLFERRRARLLGPSSAFAAIEAKRLRRWEPRALLRANRVLVFSTKDAELLRGMGVKEVSVGYPELVSCGVVQQRPTDHPRIVFLGALDRRENVEAIEWFVDQVLPQIASGVPGVELLVVGGGNGLRSFAPTARGQVRVTGYVKDLDETLATGWLAVAPLRSGAGIKVKVVEYLARGLPVVATTIGAEGIPAGPEHGLITANEPEAYAATCLELLRDRARCQALGAAAYRWFRRTYLPMTLNGDRVKEIIECLRRDGS